MRYCEICGKKTNFKRKGDGLKVLVSIILFPFGLLVWLIPVKLECTECGNFIK